MNAAWSGPVLVADVGGTHVRFALVDVAAADPLIGASARRFRAAEFASFGAAVQRYLDESGTHPAALVIAALGYRPPNSWKWRSGVHTAAKPCVSANRAPSSSSW